MVVRGASAIGHIARGLHGGGQSRKPADTGCRWRNLEWEVKGPDGLGPQSHGAPSLTEGPPSRCGRQRSDVRPPGHIRVAEQARSRTCATRSAVADTSPAGRPRSSAPGAGSGHPRSGIAALLSGWTGSGRDKTPNASGEGVLTLAWTQAGLQQAAVLPDRLPLLLSEVAEGVAAFPSPSAELAAAVPRHPDPAGYFCRISRRRDGARLRS